jgi:hypothetical protein
VSLDRAKSVLVSVTGGLIGTAICVIISLTIMGLGLRIAYQQPMNSRLTFPIIGLALVAALTWPQLLRIWKK